MGDGNTASWLRVIDALEGLDVKIVAPGHGRCGDRSLIDDQRAYIAGLRDQVAAGIDAGRTVEALQASVKVPDRLSRYVGKMFNDQISKIYAEMVGLDTPHELESLGLVEAPATARGPGWQAPKKIVLASSFYTDKPEQIAAFEKVAPGVKIVAVPDPSRDPAPLLREIVDADGLVCGSGAVSAIVKGKRLRWVHSISAGVEAFVGIGTPRTPGVTGLADSGIVLTNGQRIYGPDVADHVFAELLALTRNVKWSVEGKNSPKPGKTRWDTIHDRPWLERELRGRTMLIVGVGGIGGQIAQRAKGFGMRVVGIDPNLDTPRKNVDLLRPPAALKSLLPKADVLVLSCPLTEQTRGLIGAAEIALLPDDAYLINVARGRIVDHDALVAALREGQLAGAGMDVTEPEPLPDASPLWTMNNVVITPHIAGRSYGRNRRVFLLTRANIYRFAHGEPLLNVVDVERGY